MALVSCKECGDDVAESAVSCPKCGVSFPATETGFLTIYRESRQTLSLVSLDFEIAGRSHSVKDAETIRIELPVGKHTAHLRLTKIEASVDVQVEVGEEKKLRVAAPKYEMFPNLFKLDYSGIDAFMKSLVGNLEIEFL